MADPLYIAVVGDLHGNLLLAIELLQKWQNVYDRRLDVICQIGDFGIWPKKKEVDHATKRNIEENPERMIFNKIINPKRKRPIVPNDISEIVLVQGNHDDANYLRQQDSSIIPIPLDPERKIKYLPAGHIYNNSLRIGASGKKERFPEEKPIDVLLMHIPPYGSAKKDKGSKRSKEVIEHTQPAYAFCGHYHVEGKELDPIGKTRLFLLNSVEYNRHKKLKPGSIAIIEWYSQKEHDCRFII